MKKRLAALLSASMILSSMMGSVGSMMVLADDFDEDVSVVDEMTEEDVFEEDLFEEDEVFETEVFVDETEALESELELETETEINEVLEAGSSADQRWSWQVTVAGELTITGNAAMEDMIERYGHFPWDGFKDQIEKITIGNGITSMPFEAFRGYSGLVSVSIPASIKEIPGCAFYECKSLKNVTIADTITSIGQAAFAYCEGLESIKLPSGLTELDGDAFTGCKSLKSITVPSKVRKIIYSTFAGCSSLETVILPTGLTSIGQQAFENCTKLKDINLPDTINYLAYRAFYGCESLQSVKLPKNLTEISGYTFCKCSSLTDVILNDSLQSIEEYAFSECTSLSQIIIPKSVINIGDRAFSNCTNLKEITFKGNSISISAYAFTGSGNVVFVCDDDSAAMSYAIAHHIPYKSMTENIKAFVNRLYNTCLGRNADAGGLDYWVNQLKTGKSTGSQAAAGFIFSNESIKKNLCNSCFIEQLYRCFMGRGADSSGKQYWLNQMKNGATRADVFEGFVVSNEFAKVCDQYGIVKGDGKVTQNTGLIEGDCAKCGAKNKTVYEFIERMYTVCLGRGSDANGRTYWLNQIKNGQTGEQVALGFLTSNEIVKKKLSNDAFVEICYKAFFGRNADSTGKAYWVNKLKNGETREKVVSGFAESTEFKKLCAEYGIKAK